MTCRGYDPKAVKISKAIKAAAASIIDDTERRHVIKSYVKIAEGESKSFGRRGGKDE